MCRSVLGLLRSVGFWPVDASPFSPARSRCQARHAASRSAQRLATAPASPGEAPPKPQLVASRTADASRAYPTRNPSRPAASPTECPTSARRRSRRAQLGSGSMAGRLCASGFEAAAAARSPSGDHREPAAGPCPPRRSISGFVRRSESAKSKGPKRNAFQKTIFVSRRVEPVNRPDPKT